MLNNPALKKYLPFIVIGIGILLLVGVYFLFVKKPAEVTEEEETALIEVALADRPYTTLTPTDDGHWLGLSIEKINIPGAESLDYELLYNLPTGEPQGVPGTIMLDGQSSITRDLLLGSESSGKFRYDEGVEQGTLTLRFRNDKGKLLVKFVSKFHLQSGEEELTHVDGGFGYILKKIPTKTYFVTMDTFGVPGELPSGNVSGGPVAVLSSATVAQPGTVEMNGQVHMWDGSVWEALSGDSSDVGLFVSTSE